MIRAILVVTGLWASSAMACEDSASIALTPQTDNAPRAVIILGDILLAQPFSVRINVCDDATPNTLELDAIMPAHRHGMNYNPTITILSTGGFQAEGLVFHMPGVWEIQIKLTQDVLVSRYTHTVTVR